VLKTAILAKKRGFPEVLEIRVSQPIITLHTNGSGGAHGTGDPDKRGPYTSLGQESEAVEALPDLSPTSKQNKKSAG